MDKACKQCGTLHNLRGQACRVCKDGMYRYGMNRQQQQKLLEDQGFKCKLCSTDVELFQGHKGGMIDHNHATGEVRGVLCNRCNTIVGSLENHVDAAKVFAYIKPTGCGSVW